MEETNRIGDEEEGEAPRLDTDGLVGVYEWINAYLPESIAEQLDAYIEDGGIARDYPSDVLAVFRAFTVSADPDLRFVAASGAHNAVRSNREEGLEMLRTLAN